jgi:hypothetical protein
LILLGRLDTEQDTGTMLAVARLALNIDGSLHGAKAGFGIKGDPSVQTAGIALERTIDAKDIHHLGS